MSDLGERPQATMDSFAENGAGARSELGLSQTLANMSEHRVRRTPSPPLAAEIELLATCTAISVALNQASHWFLRRLLQRLFPILTAEHAPGGPCPTSADGSKSTAVVRQSRPASASSGLTTSSSARCRGGLRAAGVRRPYFLARKACPPGQPGCRNAREASARRRSGSGRCALQNDALYMHAGAALSLSRDHRERARRAGAREHPTAIERDDAKAA